MCAAAASSSPLRFLPRSGGAVVDSSGLYLSSALKGAWKGAAVDGLRVLPGATGTFALRVRHGLVRLGWAVEGHTGMDALGTDDASFGFGGTGKSSHAGAFTDFGEAFGDGDVVACALDRSGDGLRVEYAKNGRPLGAAFVFQPGSVPQAVQHAALVPAVCGRQFEAELCDPLALPEAARGGGAVTALQEHLRAAGEELAVPLLYYSSASCQPAGGARAASSAARGKLWAGGGKTPASKGPGPLDLLDFFLGEEAGAPKEQVPERYIERWVRSALLQQDAPEASSMDFRGCPDVRRVSRTITLPSGPTLTLIDSQPADRNAADRVFAQNVGLWEALPRGHCEVREGRDGRGRLLCEVVGLRKFGNPEEKFGPIAREAGGTRHAALAALPAALEACGAAKDWSVSLVFLTKENGENCKVSFFELNGSPYLVVGSKNVALAISAASADAAKADLAAYSEERFEFAREMAEVFVQELFGTISEGQRAELIRFVCDNKATLCGESISPTHQHIQSYRTDSGSIPAEIRFFAAAAPTPLEAAGLTLLDPAECQWRFRAWGLSAVEECDEAPVADTAAIRALEEKYCLLPNREGAVVYAVVRPHPGAVGAARTALVYKWKNAWYVTVRALREKFGARASESRVRNRIRLLHVHHPCEDAIVDEFMDFYRWALVLLPNQEFRDCLGTYWVSLKAACELFRAGSERWAQALPPELARSLGITWLGSFRSAYEALAAKLPQESWVSTLVKHRVLLNSVAGGGDVGRAVEAVLAASRGALAARAAAEAASGEEAEVVGLTAVLVRGLQGSGKSTLCRSLRALLGGRWVNQDEVAATLGGHRRGAAAKEAFLQAVEASAAQADIRYVFIDKIHTLRQHRDDVRAALARGALRRGPGSGRVALALLNLVHPEDEEGQVEHAVPLCTSRVSGRGLGHLSFVPQAGAVESIIEQAGQNAEAPGDEEKCSFDCFANLDLTKGPEELLTAAVANLEEAQLLHPDHSKQAFPPETLRGAVEAAAAHERDLQGRWKTLYWHVAVAWESVLGAGSEGGPASPGHGELRQALALAIEKAGAGGALQPVHSPHVTLLWIGDNELDEQAKAIDAQLLACEGAAVDVVLRSVVVDAALGLVTLRAELTSPSGSTAPPPPCANLHPHITAAKRPEVGAVLSNDMLQRLADGDPGVEEITLNPPVRVEGKVTRQLAMESLAMVAAGGALPEVGNPICELGLAATGDAVDIWATYDSGIKWSRVRRAFSKLFCPVSEPLQHCRGLLPALRGKQWFTIHERPLSQLAGTTLRDLERMGQFMTLHVGVAYFQVPNLLAGEKEDMQALLEGVLAGQGAEALSKAWEVWREVTALESGGPKNEATNGEAPAVAAAGPSVPKFYVQCKGSSQSATVRLRQAVAAAVASLVGWEPIIKDADVTLTVSIKEDWLLLGLVLPRQGGAAAASGAAPAAKSERQQAARLVNISKAMTQILRHSATKLGVPIRPDGFCKLADVLATKPLWLLGATKEDMEKVVRESDKQRFETREEDGELLVRAAQGHSMKEVDDEQLLCRLSPDGDLPEVCVHGTYRKFLPSILQQGLLAGGGRGGRNHVHFAPYAPGDGRVISGMRYNCEVALYIDLQQALADGYPFFKSSNEVILSPGVEGVIPARYISKAWDLRKRDWVDLGEAAASADAGAAEVGPDGWLELDGAQLEGDGWLLAFAFAALLRRGLHVLGVRAGQTPPGLPPGRPDALRAAAMLAGSAASGLEEGSTVVALPPPDGTSSAGVSGDLAFDAGVGGSAVLMLQAALPLLLSRSAQAGGAPMRASFAGGTNTEGAPQVDSALHVLAPILRRLLGVSIELDLQRRGFGQGGGGLLATVAAPSWPLPAFELLDPGQPSRVRGIAYRSTGVPAHVLPRFLEGQVKKRAMGAAVMLRERLPGVPVEWDMLEVGSAEGGEGCGVIVVVETSSGCLFAGESVGRRGAPAEQVGQEAAEQAVQALARGGCAAPALEEQLVLYMALAAGTSRLRLGSGEPPPGTRTALWLVECFGATVRLGGAEEGDRVLEVDGLGAKLALPAS